MELILIRHGETCANKEGLCHGWLDTDLTAKGIKQAHILKEKLKDERIKCVFSSPLKRCVKTAEIINVYHGLSILKEDELREINFGTWEGMSYEQIKKAYPLQSKKWEKDWKDFRIPGGESSREFYLRVSKWVSDLIKKKRDGKHVIVTHGGCIRVILSHLVGKGIDGYWNFCVKTGGMTRIRIDDGFPFLVYLD